MLMISELLQIISILGLAILVLYYILLLVLAPLRAHLSILLWWLLARQPSFMPRLFFACLKQPWAR